MAALDDLLAEAGAARARGDLDGALAVLDRAPPLARAEPPHHYARALVLLEKGALADAALALREAVSRKRPGTPFILELALAGQLIERAFLAGDGAALAAAHEAHALAMVRAGAGSSGERPGAG
jgi:hypothetical protein